MHTKTKLVLLQAERRLSDMPRRGSVDSDVSSGGSTPRLSVHYKSSLFSRSFFSKSAELSDRPQMDTQHASDVSKEGKRKSAEFAAKRKSDEFAANRKSLHYAAHRNSN